MASSHNTGLCQVNTVGSEEGSILTLAFDWAPHATATGDALKLEYGMMGLNKDDGTKVGTDKALQPNNTGPRGSGFSGKARLINLLTGDGWDDEGATAMSGATVTGTAGVTNTHVININIGGYNSNWNDISDLEYFGIGFYCEAATPAGTLDNVSVIAHKPGGDVDLTTSVELLHGSPGKYWKTATNDFPATLVDWDLFNGTSATVPHESKAGGSVLGNYVAYTNVSDSVGDFLRLRSANSTPTASAIVVR